MPVSTSRIASGGLAAGSGNDGAEELGAGGVGERLQAAAERVHQAQPRGVVGLGALDVELGGVIGDVHQDLVRFRAHVGTVRRHAVPLGSENSVCRLIYTWRFESRLRCRSAAIPV